MRPRIEGSQGMLTEQDMVRVEQALGLSLPTAYREFLLSHNGGRPKPNAFPIAGNPSDDHGLVDSFLCVDEGDVYNLEDWALEFHDRVPADLLSIAVDYVGNLICLAVTGQNAGKVYFWDHEEEVAEGETPGYGNVYFVAGSFEEFLHGLEDLR